MLCFKCIELFELVLEETKVYFGVFAHDGGPFLEELVALSGLRCKGQFCFSEALDLGGKLDIEVMRFDSVISMREEVLLALADEGLQMLHV